MQHKFSPIVEMTFKAYVLLSYSMSIELKILYSDEHLVAVNKPHGMAVHQSRMHPEDEVFALQTLRDQIGQRVYPAHRLDKKTSGVLLFGLSPEMDSALQSMFGSQEVKKTYHAIARGHLSDLAGQIDYALTNDRGQTQEAVTDYEVKELFEIPIAIGKHPTSRYSLVELKPQTGRFHQLRKHLAHIHHPIIGDRPHGCNKQNRYWKHEFQHDTMLLHAKVLGFKHPISNEFITIEAPYSAEFTRGLEIVRSNPKI